MQQAPIRNRQTIAAAVCSHSGEFAPDCTELRLGGRGLDFEFTRFYRVSRAGHIGDLGRGWSCNLIKKIERAGDDVLYHNGAGEVHRFLRAGADEYTSSPGFYGTLLQERDEFEVWQRGGRSHRFQAPEAGGAILSTSDRNHNVIQFSYSSRGVTIVDTMSRRISISVKEGLVRSLADHARRIWTYRYDANNCLIEVTRPATSDFPQGTSIKYAYDSEHRLVSLTDAKGQTYLMNSYDPSGRVVAQKHGNGDYRIGYETIGTGHDGFPIYRTSCRRKNGSTLLLEHNETGQVIVSTLQVQRESFAPEDISGVAGNAIPLVTISSYNHHGELTSRRFPAGHETKWTFTEEAENPLNLGNPSQMTQVPQAGVPSDQARIVTTYEYEPRFQLLVSRTDPRGNKTSYEYDDQGNLLATTYPPVSIQPVSSDTARGAPIERTQQCKYAYNSRGQLLRRTHIDGTVTEYHYYPIEDPTGTGGPGSATAAPDQGCGYLARTTWDADGAKIRNEYAYDQFGNTSTVFDGKGNAAHVRYNAMGTVESVIGRQPFNDRIDYKYDANYNEIESARSFERPVYDKQTRRTTLTATTLRELKEYNALDHLTARRIVGEDANVKETFVRDANERVIRQIQPLGNETAYVFDERELLITKVRGAGTAEAVTERRTYTLNGAVRTETDGNGNRTMHHYDGFQRYRGFTDPVGTTKHQWFDEMHNVVRVRVEKESKALMEAHYHFDQWNRAYRMDQSWRNLETDRALGKSEWRGEPGIVSTVVEYGENGLGGKVWSETGNVVSCEYDGAGRLTALKDLTGEESSVEYDENSNMTLLRRRGPVVSGQRGEQVLRRRHDAMDRLESQQEDDAAPERFRYNALGTVVSYVSPSGIEIHHTLDSLGRRAGHAYTVVDAAAGATLQQITRRYEYDDNFRLSAYVDANGHRTAYGYDALDRQTSVSYPDDSLARVDYDAVGNVTRQVDQNKNEIINRYDAAGRLVERRRKHDKTGTTTTEHYEYDGASRLLSATAANGTVRRSYDSLSRLLTEAQGDRVLRYGYDAAGNLTSLRYPAGDEVHRSYDIRRRVTAVQDKAGAKMASYRYGPNDQIAGMTLAGTIEAAFSYTAQQRLESIEYRRTDNHDLVDGFRYQYDTAGKMTHEIQSIAGAAYGERYYYDDANRVVRAQYGVEDVFDQNSRFEQQTSYEHFPEGSWQRRVHTDGATGRADEKVGTVDRMNRYATFGKFSFTNDANGNCVRKASSNPGHCVYTYDTDNRLIKSECFDARGRVLQTIEYFYDALGRQVRKLVTDRHGVATDYTYVWAGLMLVEEYENGMLVRTYTYASGSIPVQFSKHQPRRADFSYVFNGRGLVTGLLNKNGPNAFAEKYVYDVMGAFGVKEINGMQVGLPSRNSTVSVNSILTGNGFGSLMADWAQGTWADALGGHMDRELGAMFGKGHKSVKGAMGERFMGFLGMMGRGGHASSPAAQGTGSRSFGNPRMSLYGSSADGGTGGGAIQWLQNAAKKSGGIGPIEWTLGGLLGGLVGGLKPGDPATSATNPYGPPAPGSPSPADKAKAEEQRKAEGKDDTSAEATRRAERATENEEAAYAEAREEKDAQKDADKEKETEALNNATNDDDDEGGTTAYSDPDAATNSQVILLTPVQIEAKLNQRTRPINPDASSPRIDPSSPPPRLGGIDPTIAYFDGEGNGSIGIGIGTGTPKINIAPMDFVRDWEEHRPQLDDIPGGVEPNTGYPWP